QAVAKHRQYGDRPAPGNATGQGEEHAGPGHDDDHHRGNEEGSEVAGVNHGANLCTIRSSTLRLTPMLKPMVVAKNAVATPNVPPINQPTSNTVASRVRRT